MSEGTYLRASRTLLRPLRAEERALSGVEEALLQPLLEREVLCPCGFTIDVADIISWSCFWKFSLISKVCVSAGNIHKNMCIKVSFSFCKNHILFILTVLSRFGWMTWHLLSITGYRQILRLWILQNMKAALNPRPVHERIRKPFEDTLLRLAGFIFCRAPCLLLTCSHLGTIVWGA